jgi:hypothetical protein
VPHPDVFAQLHVLPDVVHNPGHTYHHILNRRSEIKKLRGKS